MATNEELRESIVNIATESWRLNRTLQKVLSKLDMREQEKYQSQFKWFFRRVIDALSASGIEFASIQGEKYDPGMSVTPMNIDDFEEDDELVIEQVIEPLIMDRETSTVVKSGTVMLRRREENE